MYHKCIMWSKNVLRASTWKFVKYICKRDTCIVCLDDNINIPVSFKWVVGDIHLRSIHCNCKSHLGVKSHHSSRITICVHLEEHNFLQSTLSMAISPFHQLPECEPRYNGISWKFVATSRRWSSNVKMIQLRLVTGHWASHLSMNTTLGRSLWVMWWHCHQGIFHWLTFLKKYVKSHSWKGFNIRRRFNKEIDDHHVWKSSGHVASKQLVLFCTIYLCNFPLLRHLDYWKKYF